jgi:hypothetical protein
MGIYLDHPNDIDYSKQNILDAIPSLRVLSRQDLAGTPAKGKAWLALVDNGLFSALGVLFDEQERDYALEDTTHRPFKFFEADLKDIQPYLLKQDMFEHIKFGQ